MPEFKLKKNKKKISKLWEIIAKDILNPFVPKSKILKK